MKKRLGTGWLLALGLLAAAGPAKPATPAEQFQAILKEYQTAASGTGTSVEDRKQSIARVDQLRDGLARRFLELAGKYPDDPIAVEALTQAVWMVSGNAFPAGGKDSPGLQALALLTRDHLRSGQIGAICLRLPSGFRGEYEAFLRAVLQSSPHTNVQALACLALGQFLKDRWQRLGQISQQPALAMEYERIFGQEYLEALRRRDRAQDAREIEALFERAGRQYSGAQIPYDGTVGVKAKAELFEFRHLVVGNMAPDIEGVDQDGRPFRLSDYRGKVVLIDFWNEY